MEEPKEPPLKVKAKAVFSNSGWTSLSAVSTFPLTPDICQFQVTCIFHEIIRFLVSSRSEKHSYSTEEAARAETTRDSRHGQLQTAHAAA